MVDSDPDQAGTLDLSFEEIQGSGLSPRFKQWVMRGIIAVVVMFVLIIVIGFFNVRQEKIQMKKQAEQMASLGF